MNTENLKQILLPKITEAIELFNSYPAEEEKPFDEKYKSRDILKSILAEDALHNLEEPELKELVTMVIEMMLAENLMETEEITLSCDKYRKVYERYSQGALSSIYDDIIVDMFRIKLLNSVGFSFVTADNTVNGLNNFIKAQDIYEQAKIKAQPEDFDMSQQTEKLRFIHELFKTVLKFESLQKLSTMTYFFMAQTYAKLGDKHNSAKYCGLTLERQLIELEQGNTAEWNEREFINNSIGLAQYYIGESYYRQAKLILIEALRLIVNENNADVGSLLFMLGNLYKSMFKFNSELIINKASKEVFTNVTKHINEALLNLNIKDIKPIEDVIQDLNVDKSKAKKVDENSEPIVLYDNYEDLKIYFRKGLSYYKEAMTLLPLDGYVTDYCESIKELSGLYKLTIALEEDHDRILTIEKRRDAIISEVVISLNPNIYKNLYIELTAELGDIKTVIFELYQKNFIKTGKGFKKMNQVGKEALNAWNVVSEYMESTEQALQQSYINCLYNKGRIYTKMHESDKSALKQNLITALSIYQKVKKTIYEMKKVSKVLDSSLEEQLKITEEFCDLLPLRITKL